MWVGMCLGVGGGDMSTSGVVLDTFFAMTKCHHQDIYKWKHLIWGSWFRTVRVHDHHGLINRQVSRGDIEAGVESLHLEQQLQRHPPRNVISFKNLNSNPQWYISSNKTLPPNLYQRILSTGHQAFTYICLWGGAFSFKPQLLILLLP